MKRFRTVLNLAAPLLVTIDGSLARQEIERQFVRLHLLTAAAALT